MITLISFQKSAPDIVDLLIPLLGILIVIFALNTLYEWLKTKPWKKSGIPTSLDDTLDQDVNQIHTENDNEHRNQTDLFSDTSPLTKSV